MRSKFGLSTQKMSGYDLKNHPDLLKYKFL